MKKFLLLKFIIILMTKKGSTEIRSNDMTKNSHVTDKGTSTENIDLKTAEFINEFQRLKDLMVDYIKANGKRPMTHEFNKNSKEFIDYLNFLLANVQPGVMRNQIENIVEKMNAILEQTHRNSPSDGEEVLDFFNAVLNSWKDGQDLNPETFEPDTIQNLNSDYLQNIIDQLNRNFKLDLTSKILSLEEIIMKLILGINQLFNPQTLDLNFENFITQAINNLQRIPIQQTQQLPNVMKSITSGYYKAINLLMMDHLSKSPSILEDPSKHTEKIQNLNQNDVPSATKQQKESPNSSSKTPKKHKENNDFQETQKKHSEKQQKFQENSENLQSSSEDSNSFTNNLSNSSKNIFRYFGDKCSELSEKNGKIDTEINKVSVGFEDLRRKTNTELEISTNETTQNSTETRNEDLQNSIDVSTSTQDSLQSVHGIDNSTEVNNEIDTVANSSELNIAGNEESSENLRKLNEISKNLMSENFTENDLIKVENFRKEIVELINYFQNTKYHEKAKDIYDELLSLTKTLEVFKKAQSVVNSNDTAESLQYIEKLRIKLDIIQIFYSKTNQFFIARAKELKLQLRMLTNQIHNKNPEIPQELIKINETYSNPENFNLKFLNEAKYNLTTIIYALKTIKSTKLANQLLREVQILIYKIYQIQKELKEIESQIQIPTNDTELAKLNEYKQRLSVLRTQPEPSIYKMAIELDESIKKVIKDYQIKNV